MSAVGNSSPRISVSPYKPGDEGRIVDFLNFAYPNGWGDIRQWKWHYVDHPTFEEDSVFILESDGQIVGHRGLFRRDLFVPCVGKLPTVSFGGTAVHPDFRRFGLYSRMHQATLEVARSKNACLVFTWNARGGITAKHNEKTGFTEVRTGPCYVKIINHERVFKSELRELIRGNEEIRGLLKGLERDICLGLRNSQFSVAEIIGEQPDLAEPRIRVKITFDESAFPLMLKFGLGGKLQKVVSLFVLLMSRKMKMRFRSLGMVFKLALRGVRIIV